MIQKPGRLKQKSTSVRSAFSIPNILNQAFGNGAPTATSQRWPSCPCGGFMPGAVAVAVPGFKIAGAAGALCGAGLVCVGVTVLPGGEFNGAPTAISHLWFGCPCGGFIPGAVFAGCGGVFTGCGCGAVASGRACCMFCTFACGAWASATGGGGVPELSCGSNSFLQETVNIEATRSKLKRDLFFISKIFNENSKYRLLCVFGKAKAWLTM